MIPVHPPQFYTLRTFGYTQEEWEKLLASQDGSCALCGTVPPCKRPTCKIDWEHGHLVFDHEHVPGWKKMAPSQRKRYVRGLLCPWDNRFVLGRYITIAKARAIVKYLARYERRRPKVEGEK